MTCNEPSTLNLNDFRGVYEDYEEAVFNAFIDSYIDNNVYFDNQRIIFKKAPVIKNKHDAFWHMTSTRDRDDDTRYPDLQRYKTVTWTKHILEVCYKNKNICNRVWHKKYKSRNRIIIMCIELSYVIILEKRREYIMFITSYPVTGKRKMTLIKEYESSLNR